MIETRHTPGPWGVANYNVIKGDEAGEGVMEILCKEKSVICELFNKHNLDETKANAQLIAGAPILLEAAKLAVCYLSGGSLYPELFAGHEADSGDIFLLKELKAAIDRAEGKE